MTEESTIAQRQAQIARMAAPGKRLQILVTIEATPEKNWLTANTMKHIAGVMANVAKVSFADPDAVTVTTHILP